MADGAARDGAGWSVVPVALPEPGGLRPFEVGGRKLLLCNAEGAPCVIENRCPHTAVPLAGGVLRGTVLECPVHGGKLDVRNGAPVGLPIRRKAAAFAVRASGDRIEVDLGEPAS